MNRGGEQAGCRVQAEGAGREGRVQGAGAGIVRRRATSEARKRAGRSKSDSMAVVQDGGSGSVEKREASCTALLQQAAGL